MEVIVAEMPRMDDEIYEDDFYVVTDDPDERMINLAIVERGLVLRFDYEEVIEFAAAVERARDHVRRRLDTGDR